MKPTRNSKLLESFSAYCKANPEERFWQALRNWAEVDYIKIENTVPGQGSNEVFDSFYLEGKNPQDTSHLDTNEI